MKTIFRVGLSILILSLLSCAVSPGLTSKEAKKYHAPPTPSPTNRSYTQGLVNLGTMIQTFFESGNFVVQGKEIYNKTACRDSLPIDITDMLKTAVNTIGGNIQYQVYDPQYDYYFYGDRLKLQGAIFMKNRLPMVTIEGAITECDEELDTKSESFNIFGGFGGGSTETDLDGSVNKSATYSRIGLDLRLMDFKTGRLLPRKQTTMAVDVHTLEKGRNFGFYIYGSGLGLSIDGRRKVTQGKHNAVRALGELSTIQLIGRYLELPYWRCLPGTEPDPIVIALMRDDFRSLNQREKISTAQYLLKKCGYRIAPNGNLDRNTQLAVQDFRQRYVRGPVQIDDQLYVDLMSAVPMPFERGGRITPPPASLSRPQQQSPTPAQPSDQPGSRERREINFTKLGFFARRGGTGKMIPIQEGTTLRSGDAYKVVFQTDQNCFVYIFQLDSAGQFYQLHPMESFGNVPLQSRNPVRANTTYVLPDKRKSFILDETTGKERIYLMAFPRRNREIESLYQEIHAHRGSQRAVTASRRMERYITARRGLAGISDSRPISVPWGSTGDVFSAMNRKLESVCGDCVFFLDFNHR